MHIFCMPTNMHLGDLRHIYIENQKKKKLRLTRLDQITLRTGVARATNCATAPNRFASAILEYIKFPA
ncbi:hypothetical protein VN97_g10769 [Penicillium thymicola]|uniref:Uncharacterized protein n=1 Tax=Penicillium thymicola TaxID=293382 RepID=A0AAI9X429_PENTH|nr:hypothetical protein VN97_g10769 [Penicillium thymicola]